MNWKISLHFASATAALFFLMPSLVRGQMGQTSPAEAARAEKGMSFDLDKTTHHFKLLAEGGIIEITANDPSDIVTRDAIQRHIAKIARMFTEGNFTIPMLVHEQTPSGVDTMKRLKSELSYAPENLSNGGRVRITTSNPQALNAVHDFLRFQIQERKTGDSLADPGPVKRPHPANNLGRDAPPAPP